MRNKKRMENFVQKCMKSDEKSKLEGSVKAVSVVQTYIRHYSHTSF